MDGVTILAVLFRWLHISAAAIAIGGVFFVRVVLPGGQQEAVPGWRRGFKMVIHTCILLLLASGIYNSIQRFPQYSSQPGLLHGLWGLHILLGLAVFGISLWLLAGREPRPGQRKWMMVNLVLLLLVVAVASTLKTVREAGSQRVPPAAGAVAR